MPYSPDGLPIVEPPGTLADRLDDLAHSRTFVEHYTELLKVAQDRVNAKTTAIVAAMEAAGIEAVYHAGQRYWLRHSNSPGHPAINLGSEPCAAADEVMVPAPPKVAGPAAEPTNEQAREGEWERAYERAYRERVLKGDSPGQPSAEPLAVAERVGGTSPWSGQPGDGFEALKVHPNGPPLEQLAGDPPAWLSEEEKRRWFGDRPRPVVHVAPAFGGPNPASPAKHWVTKAEALEVIDTFRGPKAEPVESEPDHWREHPGG